MKNCIKCGVKKELSEFHKHSRMSDGTLNKCKDCVRAYVKAYNEGKLLDPEFRESEKDRHREKYHRLGYKEKHKRSTESKNIDMSRYNNKYPEKKICKNMCSGLKRTQGCHLHHWCYKKEFAKDVIEMEFDKHYLLHRNIIYDQEFMMYRDCHGILLESKQSHIDLLNKILEK